MRYALVQMTLLFNVVSQSTHVGSVECHLNLELK